VILVDTSAWVEYDRATGSPVERRLAELIETAGPIAVTEPIMIEVLAGAGDDRREQSLRALLLRFELLRFDPVADFDSAALVYRRCRAAGITPRGLLDCMIAAVAWRNRTALLAQDADLDRVAGIVGVALDRPARR
jgi:predicted nucleic acid-binding protein